ncbi:MAG: SMC-Scp complex subunit ScpB [Methylacidiphilales bacterium]|nr:SMC-Scp complex subunit ScpB [Candidatus Methylacidiphilales bacterium]
MMSLTKIVKSLLLVSDKPLTIGEIVELLPDQIKQTDTSESAVEQKIELRVKESVIELVSNNDHDCLVLKEVASGYRYQIDESMSSNILKLWETKTHRYSNALIETLAIIAWKQPVTRGDVEDIRGVSVSQNIFRVLLDREWVKVTGYRESLGKPALYGTTKAFLDYFNLKDINELPPLPEPKTIDELTMRASEKSDALIQQPSQDDHSSG